MKRALNKTLYIIAYGFWYLGSTAAFSSAVSTLRWPLSTNVTSGEVSPQGDMEEP